MSAGPTPGTVAANTATAAGTSSEGELCTYRLTFSCTRCITSAEELKLGSCVDAAFVRVLFDLSTQVAVVGSQ